jgi:hypothetical protein
MKGAYGPSRWILIQVPSTKYFITHSYLIRRQASSLNACPVRSGEDFCEHHIPHISLVMIRLPDKISCCGLTSTFYTKDNAIYVALMHI